MRRRAAAVLLALTSGGCAQVLGLEPSYYLAAPDAGEPIADPYALAVSEDGPLSWWRLGESPGEAIARDEIESGYDGRYAATAQLGLSGIVSGDAAAAFGAGDARVEVADVYDFDGRASFSVEAWVAPRVLVDSARRVVSKEVCCDDPRDGYALSISETAVLFQRIINSSFETAGKGTAIPTGRFSHLVGTYDGDAQRICLYIDGVLDECRAATRAMRTTTATLTIGSLSGYDRAVDATIDEVAIYDKVLDAARVAAHFEAALL